MSVDGGGLRLCRSGPLRGTCRVPGDKSISHRGLIFAAMADGSSRIEGFLDGRDCLATLAVLRDLGLAIEKNDAAVTVHGRGIAALREPEDLLDCQNSGTTLRLMTGLLASRPFLSILGGSPQLRSRPMGRVVEPLRAMGARILGREGGRLAPLVIEAPPGGLRALDYTMPVASAQVKSALILAGLLADAPSRIREPGPARDHSERMLAAMGAPITCQGGVIEVAPLEQTALRPLSLTVPGDPSSAAFLIVAASLIPGSDVRIEGVGLNPTRAGLIEALRAMGASIDAQGRRVISGEPVADLRVRGGELRGADFGGADIVTMIDELPCLALAATAARGPTVIRDALELRVKESDRIAATVAELRKLDAAIDERPDGFAIAGSSALSGAAVDAHGDHRLAMTLAVAGLTAEGETLVSGAETIPDSFPGFVETLRSLGAELP